MSLSQGLTTQAKYAALGYVTAGTLKMALYTGNATLGPSTLVYTTANEVSSVGTGYTAGGKTLTGVTLQQGDGVAYLSFDNVTWSPADFTARGALIYNTSLGNLAVAVLDFGADKTATTSFTVQLPADTSSAAIIRIA
jgi:hypothetical protein